MTWSIIARDPSSGAFGVAIASRFLAVGSLCPYVRSGVGALCTQALGHPPHGAAAFDLLAAGLAAPEVLARLLEEDPDRAHRQIHIIDRQGRNAAHTGDACIGWCGDLVADAVSVAGNMLVGPAVIRETLAAFAAVGERPLADRLLGALAAGQAAGGDKRGQQAAALLIHASAPHAVLDLRIDNHPEAVGKLQRLYEEARRDYIPYLRRLMDATEAATVFGPA